MMSREAPAVGLAPLRSRQVESYRFRCEQSCCQGRRGPLGPTKQDKRNQSQEATKAVCSFSSAPRQGPSGVERRRARRRSSARRGRNLVALLE
jgi:hypothetical protein